MVVAVWGWGRMISHTCFCLALIVGVCCSKQRVLTQARAAALAAGSGGRRPRPQKTGIVRATPRFVCRRHHPLHAPLHARRANSIIQVAPQSKGVGARAPAHAGACDSGRRAGARFSRRPKTLSLPYLLPGPRAARAAARRVARAAAMWRRVCGESCADEPSFRRLRERRVSLFFVPFTPPFPTVPPAPARSHLPPPAQGSSHHAAAHEHEHVPARCRGCAAPGEGELEGAQIQPCPSAFLAHLPSLHTHTGGAHCQRLPAGRQQHCHRGQGEDGGTVAKPPRAGAWRLRSLLLFVASVAGRARLFVTRRLSPRPALLPAAGARCQGTQSRGWRGSAGARDCAFFPPRIKNGRPLIPCPCSPRLVPSPFFQAPMSRLEPTEFINDRYSKMEENLAASFGEKRRLVLLFAPACLPPSTLLPSLPPQIVRRRLNRPLTLAEKVSQRACGGGRVWADAVAALGAGPSGCCWSSPRPRGGHPGAPTLHPHAACAPGQPWLCNLTRRLAPKGGRAGGGVFVGGGCSPRQTAPRMQRALNFFVCTGP